MGLVTGVGVLLTQAAETPHHHRQRFRAAQTPLLLPRGEGGRVQVPACTVCMFWRQAQL
jgi:hypothetical protein